MEERKREEGARARGGEECACPRSAGVAAAAPAAGGGGDSGVSGGAGTAKSAGGRQGRAWGAASSLAPRRQPGGAPAGPRRAASPAPRPVRRAVAGGGRLGEPAQEQEEGEPRRQGGKPRRGEEVAGGGDSGERCQIKEGSPPVWRHHGR